MDKVAEAVAADIEWRELLESMKRVVTSPAGVASAITQLLGHIAESRRVGDSEGVKIMLPYLKHFESLAKKRH